MVLGVGAAAAVFLLKISAVVLAPILDSIITVFAVLGFGRVCSGEWSTCLRLNMMKYSQSFLSPTRASTSWSYPAHYRHCDHLHLHCDPLRPRIHPPPPPPPPPPAPAPPQDQLGVSCGCTGSLGKCSAAFCLTPLS
jgi:hypothetical protein